MAAYETTKRSPNFQRMPAHTCPSPLGDRPTDGLTGHYHDRRNQAWPQAGRVRIFGTPPVKVTNFGSQTHRLPQPRDGQRHQDEHDQSADVTPHFDGVLHIVRDTILQRLDPRIQIAHLFIEPVESQLHEFLQRDFGFCHNTPLQDVVVSPILHQNREFVKNCLILPFAGTGQIFQPLIRFRDVFAPLPFGYHCARQLIPMPERNYLALFRIV